MKKFMDEKFRNCAYLLPAFYLIIWLKALDREVEPYGFFLVKALRKYHHALGRVLLPIAPCLFR